MSKFFVKFDTKSFYFNVENDNEKGHTATVATVMKQGSTTDPVLELLKVCSSNVALKNEGLLHECTKNSKSVVKITNILIFDKIFLNGEQLMVDSQFCMYLKEEVDPGRIQFGRVKLHYPSSFKYSNFEFDIDNRAIINAISERLHGFAFLINGVELFDESGKINFISTIIGANKIPYSKVFLNYKGDASTKFIQVFNEVADNYEIEAPKMREKGIPNLETIVPSTYKVAYEYCKHLAIRIFLNSLNHESIENIQINTDTYPYDLCDVELLMDGRKKYYIVFFTATMQDYFFLSLGKSDFLYAFQDECEVVLVKDVLSKTPIIEKFSFEDTRGMRKDLEVIKYSK